MKCNNIPIETEPTAVKFLDLFIQNQNFCNKLMLNTQKDFNTADALSATYHQLYLKI